MRLDTLSLKIKRSRFQLPLSPHYHHHCPIVIPVIVIFIMTTQTKHGNLVQEEKIIPRTSWGMSWCIRRDRQGALSGSLREAFRHMTVMVLQPSSGTMASLAL